MTDQSKPTTDMPDVIYIRYSNNIGYFSEPRMTFHDQIKYIRADKCAQWDPEYLEWVEQKSKDVIDILNPDLVPAAPTGDKAAALDNANEAIATLGLLALHCEEVTASDVAELEHKIRAALQENTAPDDLIKALEFYAAKENWMHGSQEPADVYMRGGIGNEVAAEALAAHKQKTQVAE